MAAFNEAGDAAGDGQPTLYDVLQCNTDASHHDLRQAYKQQALHWHPDKNSDPEAEELFKRLNTAWSVLSDEASRAAYDRSLLYGESEQQSYRHAHNAGAEACRAAWKEFMKAEVNNGEGIAVLRWGRLLDST
jgi:DnaJ-class molecular chaperone